MNAVRADRRRAPRIPGEEKEKPPRARNCEEAARNAFPARVVIIAINDRAPRRQSADDGFRTGNPPPVGHEGK